MTHRFQVVGVLPHANTNLCDDPPHRFSQQPYPRQARCGGHCLVPQAFRSATASCLRRFFHRSEEAVCWASQSQVIAQRGASVFGSEHTAPPQFRHDLVDEIIQATR